VIAVDTSAIIAVLWGEKDESRIRTRLAAESSAILSAGSALELQIVLAGTGAIGAWDSVEAFFSAYGISVRPFDDIQLAIARAAAIRFGKGRHKAKLNYGDCFAYALAMSEGLPLLFTGKDFAETDVIAA